MKKLNSLLIETSGFIYKNSTGKIEDVKMLWQENKTGGMRTENSSLFGMTYCKGKVDKQSSVCLKILWI